MQTAGYENWNTSVTLNKYKDTTKRILKMSFPNMRESDFDEAIDYSINKRLYNTPANVYNNYKHSELNSTLLEIADYIYSREPILTAYGVMFRKHKERQEPLLKVIQSFLDNRAKDKAKMFTYEKGSEDYEHWNLIQLLDKIDANGVFGILTMNASMVYNLHVGASILAQSRSQISSLSMLFEMFLANNVKFGSLDEIVIYIDNIVQEKRTVRQFKDSDILDEDVHVNQVFGHIIMMCGWLWIPDEDDMQIIWDILNNLSQEDLNRIYYKNNLYEFMNNSSMKKALHDILAKLERPYLEPMKPPQEIQAELDVLRDLICEYVYYAYQIPDRIDRNANMIKSIIMISDTDSCIISLDAWYRFGLSVIGREPITIARQEINPFVEIDKNYMVNGEYRRPCVEFMDKELDYDFYNDEVIEKEHMWNPVAFIPQDNVRYSIINIMCYVLDRVVNDYMLRFTKANFSYTEYIPCKIIAKNEFLMKRALLSNGKKNYASYQEIQEGNFVPEDEALDVKGLAALRKSSSPKSTQDALQKILWEDILKADNIDQVKIIKDLAILEHRILDSILSGSKDYYKPANVKSMSSYTNPMRIQGIKASLVWNELRGEDNDVLDLEARNHVEIAKVILNKSTVYKLQDYPEVHDKAVKLLQTPEFSKGIDAIAIPTTEDVPKWLTEIVDTDSIVIDNISGFPLESVNVRRLDKQVCLSSMLKL